ncbi:hypothetical protein ACFL27_24260 [candidate division CSSED10-310 bacterium]|uniref:7-cyano-7-deazaguanine synthase n=1 Tax=candidate division CSSED10-310 bacterium TaxID=2855610 RepID=A0ABV6Z4F5_UNCC1
MGTTLHIQDIKSFDNQSLLETWLCVKSHRRRVYFRSNDLPLAAHNESLVAMTLLPSMKKGYRLVTAGAVSEQFMAAIEDIQDIFCSWDSSLQKIKISGTELKKSDPPAENRIGTFFSGGVDSFYTLLKHRSEITDLIFVIGFDIRLDDDVHRERTTDIIRTIGTNFGKRVIVVETNLRSFFDPYVHWGNLGHGAALACVGHLLSSFFKRIYIPATLTQPDIQPCGSHPLIDPLWSTESLEFVHDGYETNRIDKIRFLAPHDVVLQSLRVCFKNPQSSYNCGRCEKCLRTMICLYIAGELDRCTTFNEKLDLKRISNLFIFRESVLTYYRAMLQELEPERDNALYQALEKVLNQPQWQMKIRGGFEYLRHRLRVIGRRFPRLYHGLKWLEQKLKNLHYQLS